MVMLGDRWTGWAGRQTVDRKLTAMADQNRALADLQALKSARVARVLPVASFSRVV
jgi:hypothetical protein